MRHKLLTIMVTLAVLSLRAPFQIKDLERGEEAIGDSVIASLPKAGEAISDYLCPPAYAADKGGGPTTIFPCHCEARRPMSLRGAAGDEAISDKPEIASSSRPSVGTPRNDIRALWRAFSDFLCLPAYAADKGNDPVAHWRFDEGGGSYAYDSMNASPTNRGTLQPGDNTGSNDTAGEMWSTAGKIGNALECDGTNDYVDFTDIDEIDGATSFTICAWIKTNSISDSKLISRKGASMSPYYLWVFSDYTISFGIYIGATAYTAATTDTVTVGQWAFVAGTYDGETVRTYINGVEKAANTDSSGAVNSNSEIVTVGYAYPGTWPNAYFSGLIDDVRIYNYARTAAQILVDYNAGSARLGTGIDPNEGNAPVGYWKFDENTGDYAYDRSGNGNNGTLGGGTAGYKPSWAPGKHGAALSFDGGDDYVSIPDKDILDISPAITVEAWFKADSVGAGKCIVSKGAGTGWDVNYHLVHNTDSKVQFGFYTVSSGAWHNVISDTTLVPDTWYHVVGTYNGSHLIIYLNGKLEDDISYTSTLPATTSDLGIGMQYWTAGYGWYAPSAFSGLIDEVKIYNYARTQAQIAYDYNKGAPVAHYRFDEGTSTIAHNSASSAHSGAAPVGWWRMDAASSGSADAATITDYSGKGNNGTADNGADNLGMSWTTGKIGPGALDFDGVDDYISLPLQPVADLIADQFTFEFWANPGTVADRPTFGFTDSSSGNVLNPFCSYDSLFQVANGTTYQNLGAFPIATANTWTHYAFIDDGTNYKLYVNSVETLNIAITINPAYATDRTFVIGQSGFSGDYADWFNGSIDDVHIYNYARTAEQIYNDYKTTHGTLVGDTKFVDGKLGKALSFDGTGDYAIVPASSDLALRNALTFEAWIKPESYGDWIRILENEVGCCTVLGLSADHGVYFGLTKGGSQYYINGISSITLNVWQHVAGTWDGSTMRTYVNGVQKDTMSLTGPIDDKGSSRWFIGRWVGGAGYDFDGLIDDVRIYNYARSAAQIAQDYTAGASRLGAQRAGVADPWGGALPVAHWKLDENTGVLARDASENANDGTLGGDGAGTDVPTWTQGKVGPGLSFDANDDIVSATNSASLDITGAVTLTAWVYSKGSTGDYQVVCGKGYDDQTLALSYWLQMPLNTTKPEMCFKSGTTEYRYTSPDNISLNAWHFIAGTKDATTQKIYVDGVEKNSGAGGTSNASTAPFTIGRWTKDNDKNPFNGLIDDVKIYNYARTQAQIAWDYNKGQPVAYYRFDESSGTDAYDDTGNNNGTVTIGATGTQLDIAAARTAGATGKFGRCMSFDGTDDYVSASDSGLPTGSSGPASLSAWISTTQTGEKYFLGWGTRATAREIVLGMMNNHFVVESYGGAMEGNTVINDGNWHHVIVVWTGGSNVTAYVDGILQSLTENGTFGPINILSSGNLDIGRLINTAGSTYSFTGLLDDVRIYNYARTAAQVMQDFNRGVASRLGD